MERDEKEYLLEVAGLEEFITEERETKTERNRILEAAGKRAKEKDPKPERPEPQKESCHTECEKLTATRALTKGRGGRELRRRRHRKES